jgi:hypothetical protein
VVGATPHLVLKGGFEAERERIPHDWSIVTLTGAAQGADPTDSEIIVGFGFPTMAFDTYRFDLFDGTENIIIFDWGVRVHGCCPGNRNIGPIGPAKV